MKNQSYKQTSIPHRTIYGEPMAYYVLSEDGIETKVTRTLCLAKSDKPSSPFSQCWYVDEESGLVLRLPRTQAGYDFARENMRFIWREAKRKERDHSCPYKGKKCCGWKADENGFRECEHCTRYTTRILELDKPYGDEDGEQVESFQLASDYDLQSIVENKALLDILFKALAELSEDEQRLIRNIFWKEKTERELAVEMGFKQSKSVNKRKQKILEKLRQNQKLKNFFEF